MPGQFFELEVQPKIPDRFKRLEALANDLYYSWDRTLQRLFEQLDPRCWERCLHNPKVFLRQLSQSKLDEAATDLVFVEDYSRVLSAYDTYLEAKSQLLLHPTLDARGELVAYFCFEYGFHESFPIYSGGLGILAADYCKAMSDRRIRFVAVGLLYRQGYFSQTVDTHGQQQANYPRVHSADLPVTPVLDDAGEEVRVHVDLAGRQVALKVWRTKAGHITLYLLDSDLPENNEADRSITHQLYGGDNNDRIQQEIVLGIGGIRALRALHLNPSVWHINEGHAAFLVLERCREFVSEGLDFASALEVAAAGTVFTSHTPVAAGHDVFDRGLMRSYFSDFVHALNIDEEHFFSLGNDPSHPERFNMTALALRGSRFQNGVSEVNGQVAAEMNTYVWPEIPSEENPFGYVTNGIHVPTFLGLAWIALFDMYFGSGWRNRLSDQEFWGKRIERIPNHVYLSTHQVLKTEMLVEVQSRLENSLRRNGVSETRIRRMTRYLNPNNTDILTICFARRFATYKRAKLLFTDFERLTRLLNNPERPVVFIFTGKAHPKDKPGQQMIKEIYEIAMQPEFEGKVIFLEDYNLSLARRLYPGVDVWLNNPRYPLEACGTSGMKAGINGVINLSVLDGWWAEAYDDENGWAIAPHSNPDPNIQDREEAAELLDILEQQVIPTYYENGGHGDSEAWVKRSKASMRTILPRFNADRMAWDYIRDYYEPAIHQRRLLLQDKWGLARELAAWKQKVQQHWPNMRLHLANQPQQAIQHAESMPIVLAVELNGLAPEDVVVECVIGRKNQIGQFMVEQTIPLETTSERQGEATLYKVDLGTHEKGLKLFGAQCYQIRAYPYHRLLSHRFECGLMRWL